MRDSFGGSGWRRRGNHRVILYFHLRPALAAEAVRISRSHWCCGRLDAATAARRRAIAALAIVALSSRASGTGLRVIETTRSFFGVHRVVETTTGTPAARAR